MHRNARRLRCASPFCILFFFLIFWLPASPVAAADPALPADDLSICDRTDEVRIAIQKEIAAMRFTSGEGGVVRCNRVGADELQRISSLHIIEKNITALKPGDFDGLHHLKTLDLEGNQIKALDPQALSALDNLENLFVARNPIKTLQKELHALPRLRRIDLSGCQLSVVAPGAFDGNPLLESVFLSDNALTRLPEGLFREHPFVRILDLSGNWLFELPHDFVSDKVRLRSLDLSRNLINHTGLSTVTKLPPPEVVNISDNPFETSDEPLSLQAMFDPACNVVTDNHMPLPLRRLAGTRPSSAAPGPEGPVAEGIEKLRLFVRSHWHVPIRISADYSATDADAEAAPGLRAREERLLLRQFEEVREAYRRAAFDFFEVSIRFESPDSPRKTPAVGFNKKTLGIVIVLQASADGRQPARPASDDLILETLADHFSRNRFVAWYTNETPAELEAALKRDFEKIALMDDELRFDVLRLEDLVDTAMERMDRAGGKKFFSETELAGARLIQFRMMLTFQRLENTMARWHLAESDDAFAYRAEVRLILAQASGMYRTYLDWFLNIVVGDRSSLNALDEDWYRLHPIFKILDSEVPAGFFNLDGRISTRIPDGAVRDLLKSRLSARLLHFLFGLRTLDRKVSPDNIELSPLRAHMLQSRERIAQNRRLLKIHQISDVRAFKELWEAKVKNSVKFPVYRVTTSIASLIGDTRFSHPSPAITDRQIEEMKAILKPGDLIVSRSDYYLSNAFLGGFWPHGIFYLGTARQWSGLRLADGTILAEDPWIFKNILPNYRSAKDDHPARVMEAISEGVVFNSLEEAVQKDYIVIFRPRFAPDEQEAKVAEAIRRALRYYGRAYDFDFDFFTDDKLVCTELLYRAYHPDINFLIQKQAVVKPAPPVPGMVKKAGRDTMPASEIVKLALYMHENQEPKPSIAYSGQTLQFVRLYMKQANGKPARVLQGPEGIAALRMTLKDGR